MISDRLRNFSADRMKTPVIVLSAFLLAYLVGEWILYGTAQDLWFRLLAIVATLIALTVLTNWRHGVFLFLLWVVAEDLPRKWLGNSMVVYFGKDVLVGVIYLAFLLEWTKGRTRSFRPPFLIPLLLFMGVVLVQAFNPHSPSVYYGFLGIKLYLYYMPLMFVGYSMLVTETDLRRLFRFGIGLAAVVAALGITQGIVGLDFLNPSDLAPELERLGKLTRMAPVSRQAVARPSAVFVSDGRFATYVLSATPCTSLLPEEARGCTQRSLPVFCLWRRWSLAPAPWQSMQWPVCLR